MKPWIRIESYHVVSVELEAPVPVVAELLLVVDPVEVVKDPELPVSVPVVKVAVELEVDGKTVMMLVEVILDVHVKEVSVVELCD